MVELWYSPWRVALFVMNSERVDSVVKEALKGAKAAVVEEVMGERHLVKDVVVKW